MYRARPASPARRPRRPLLPGSEPAVLTILRYLFHLSCNSFSFHMKVTTFIQRCVSGRGSRELVRSDAAGADHGRITTYSREVSSAAPLAAAAGNTFTTQTMSSSRGTTRSPRWPVRDKPATRMEGARELREWCFRRCLGQVGVVVRVAVGGREARVQAAVLLARARPQRARRLAHHPATHPHLALSSVTFSWFNIDLSLTTYLMVIGVSVDEWEEQMDRVSM